jgi:hypothetical protein
MLKVSGLSLSTVTHPVPIAIGNAALVDPLLRKREKRVVFLLLADITYRR